MVKPAPAPLVITNPATGEERGCSQSEFDETFEPAGWEIVEPVEPLRAGEERRDDRAERRDDRGDGREDRRDDRQ